MNIEKLIQDHQLEGFCRGCLIRYENPTDLLQYTEKNRRLFVYSTGLQVKRNDIFTFQLCKDCYVNMKLSCKFKKQCRTSDKQFKSFLHLKEISDIDLCTFLKNSNDTLRFPLLSGNSTPAIQRNKDDDNESTCTSIQNFMSDMLQGTEMPDSEARIIKEVIEEEADVLEESLDSHWLQDDVSIDTDFRLDFSFSPFSTRSINNDHCYTPSKEIESSRNSNNHVKKVLEQLPTMREDSNDDSPKDISINGIKEVLREICGKTPTAIEEDYMQDNLIEECVDVNGEIPMFQTDLDMPELINDADNNFPPHSEIDIAVKHINIDFDGGVNKKHFYIPNDYTVGIKEKDVYQNQINYEVSDTEVADQNTECSIDRKLKEALENNDKAIPLEDLLVSSPRDFPVPAVSIGGKIDFSEAIGSSTPNFVDITETIGKSTKDNEGLPKTNDTSTPNYESIPKASGILTPTLNIFRNGTGASTPMINNILFGEKLELGDSNNECKMQECAEKIEKVNGECDYADILDELFNTGEKEIDKNEENEPVATKTEHLTDAIKSDKDLLSDDEKVKLGDDSESLLCKICNKKYPTAHGIRLHMAKKHIIKISTKKDVDTDEQDSYNVEDRSCKICNKKYPTNHGIRLHMAKKHKIKMSKIKAPINDDIGRICSHCGIAIKDRSNYSRHVRSHKMGNHKCPLCPMLFSSEANLKKHSHVHKDKAVEGKKEKTKERYVCPTCGLSFVNASGLSAHERRHGPARLACRSCPKRFYRTNDLARHERLSFVNASGLSAHERRHGPARLACRSCPKRFYRTNDLARHERIHADERQHACAAPGCGKAFLTKYNLVVHMRTHTGQKPFECHYCSKTFYRKDSLIKHIQASSLCMKKRLGIPKEKRPIKYTCYFCNKNFATKGRFTKHQELSAFCKKRRDEDEGMNRSTIKVQLPYLYPEKRKEKNTYPEDITIREEGKMISEK